ncbi:alanine acetyltransferase [Heyndrickxia shackletonii]|uniref:Alanine acetyltransferase n=1 Tax=Heyndrickxia shackletonii TaxID=157838 RepID=A0A0Q3WSZ2_9BACI|nr:GNAT family protein [Heyndrickxia shackletonii]KQL51220.1 alanine acetyltransferase [Heyndrickxia shackletonii]NEY98512.1 GNAT family N-acetyltransferase [Heyndrickxia shackletonii]
MSNVLELTEIPVIETDNYYLRGLTLEDAANMFPFMSDHETMKYITPHPVRTIKELEASILRNLENFKQKKEIPWSIVHKQNNQVVGMFRFHKLHTWHQKVEMGVVIHKDFQKKGVMTEILPEILEFGFNTLGLNRIVGDIFADNEGSKRLMEKFGFHKDGVLRETDFDGERFYDTVVYSMLKSEYRVGLSGGK